MEMKKISCRYPQTNRCDKRIIYIECSSGFILFVVEIWNDFIIFNLFQLADMGIKWVDMFSWYINLRSLSGSEKNADDNWSVVLKENTQKHLIGGSPRAVAVN